MDFGKVKFSESFHFFFENYSAKSEIKASIEEASSSFLNKWIIPY